MLRQLGRLFCFLAGGHSYDGAYVDGDKMQAVQSCTVCPHEIRVTLREVDRGV